MISNVLKTCLDFIPVVLFITIILTWIYSRSKARGVLEKWAGARRLKLSKLKQPMFSRGPFPLSRMTTTEVVYEFTVIDEAGRPHSGWARVGGGLWGPMDGSIEVQLSNSNSDIPGERG